MNSITITGNLGKDAELRNHDALDAFDEISGDEMEPAHPTAGIWVPTELAERVQETMGEFLMDHGWRQQDMDTSDEFGALLAVATKAAPKSAPVAQGDARVQGLIAAADYIDGPASGYAAEHSYTEPSPMAKVAAALRQKAEQEDAAYQARRSDQGLMESEWGPMEDAPPHEDPPMHVAVVEGDDAVRTLQWNRDVAAFAYPVGTLLYADRAMRAQAAPAAVASPLTKLQRKAIAVCFTSDKVSVSEVQRKLSISYADAQTLCQSIVDLGLTDELELAPSLKRGAPAPHPAPVAQGDARAEQALLKVLTAVQRYLPPDGPSAKDTLAEIIGIIDPWPLGDQKGKA